MAETKVQKMSDLYPEDVFSADNYMRSIFIIVKENNLSVSKNADEIVEEAKRLYAEFTDIFNKFAQSTIASDRERQQNFTSRIKKLRGSNIKTIYGVGLPLPNELTDSQSHNWNQETGAVKDIADGLSGNPIVGTGLKALKQLASNSGVRKPLVDPGYFQDYTGSDLREFTFNWDFIPESSDEAESIMSIVYNLKKFSLPTSTLNNLALRSPFLFDITFPNPRLNNIVGMNDVVCKSIEVNYSADGSLQFYPDGMTKYMRLSMTFAERKLVTGDLY